MSSRSDCAVCAGTGECPCLGLEADCTNCRGVSECGACDGWGEVTVFPADAAPQEGPGASHGALRTLLVLVLTFAMSGCVAPLAYLKQNPVPVPTLVPVPPVPEYEQLDPTACPRFVYDEATDAWVRAPWESGARLAYIPKDYPHPAVNTDGTAACLQVVVPPGAWIQAVEARDRLPRVEEQRDALLLYIEKDRERDRVEDEAMIDLVRDARRRQFDAFGVGVLIGGGSVVAVVVSAVVAVAVAED